jgi:hypothetical protein
MSIARPVSLNIPPDIRENFAAAWPACDGSLFTLSAVPNLARLSRPSSARPNTISATQRSFSASRACDLSFMIVSHLVMIANILRMGMRLAD